MPYLGYTPPPSPVSTIDIQAGAIANTDLGVGAVTSHAIAVNAVTSEKIGVDVIVAEDLASNSITVAELQDAAVTFPKLYVRWVDKSSGGTIAVGNKCMVGTANDTVSLTLPITSLSVGDEVEFLDKDGYWNSNNATVHSGASTIMIDNANNFILDTSNTSVKLIYTESNLWKTQVWN